MERKSQAKLHEASTQPSYEQIKLALAVHAASIVVARMIDGAKPQPPQTFKPADFLAWAKKRVGLAKKVITRRHPLKDYWPASRKAFSSTAALPPKPARLLAGIGSDLARYANKVAVLQAFADTAPISFQAGQRHQVKMRWACDKFLRHTVHLWADCFRRASSWGEVYYPNKRQAGMSHACALGCLDQRLLKIVFRMISDKKPYDPDLHARNQQN